MLLPSHVALLQAGVSRSPRAPRSAWRSWRRASLRKQPREARERAPRTALAHGSGGRLELEPLERERLRVVALDLVGGIGHERVADIVMEVRRLAARGGDRVDVQIEDPVGQEPGGDSGLLAGL